MAGLLISFWLFSLSYSQIWLIPLVDDGQHVYYITKLEKHTPEEEEEEEEEKKKNPTKKIQ